MNCSLVEGVQSQTNGLGIADFVAVLMEMILSTVLEVYVFTVLL